MPQTTIGSLSAKLGLDYSVFSGGLDKSLKEATAFTRNVSRVLSSPLGIAGGVANAPAQLLGGFLGPVKDVLSSIPLIGGAFAAIPTSAGAFSAWIKEQSNQIIAIGKQAQRFGVDTETMGALMQMAGPNAEALTHGLAHMQRVLADTQLASERTGKGIAGFGIDMQRFNAASTAGKVGMIADRMKELKDPTDKAALAMGFFGHSGSALVPMLEQGSGAIEAMKEKLDKMGLGFSGGEFKAVLEAQKALGDIDRTIQGIGRRFAVELSPFIEAGAKTLMGWVDAAGGVKPAIHNMVSGAVEGFSLLLDMIGDVIKELKKLKQDYDDFRSGNVAPAIGNHMLETARHPGILKKLPGTTGLIFGASESIFAAADQARAGGLLGGEQPEAKLGDMLRNKWKQFEEDASKNLSGKGGGAALADSELVAAISQTVAALSKELDTLGMTAQQKQIYELRTRGAKEEQLEFARGLADGIQALGKIESMATTSGNIFEQYSQKIRAATEAVDSHKLSQEALKGIVSKLDEDLEKSMSSRAAELFKEAQTPIDRFYERMDELDSLLERGKIGWDLYSKSLGKATEGLMHMQDIQVSNPAAEAGSREFFSAVARAEAGANQGSGINGIQNILQQQKAIQDRQAEYQRQTVDELRRLRPVQTMGPII
jgi:hypothetical protein